MADSEYIKLNIAIRPPENIFKLAKKFSNQCPGSNRAFTIDELRIPHITIYYVEFPLKNLDKILKQTAEICSKTKPFNMTFEKADFALNYFFAYFKRTEAITTFHKKFLDLVNPLREGHQKDKYQAGNPEFENLPSTMQKNILKYGHLNTGSTFFPHLSLTYYEGKHPKLSEMPEVELGTFVAKKIIIFTGGEFGTTEKILKEFSLSVK
jgi:2'-5' RNA ligase